MKYEVVDVYSYAYNISRDYLCVHWWIKDDAREGSNHVINNSVETILFRILNSLLHTNKIINRINLFKKVDQIKIKCQLKHKKQQV